jgi:hypothetical protein
MSRIAPPCFKRGQVDRNAFNLTHRKNIEVALNNQSALG